MNDPHPALGPQFSLPLVQKYKPTTAPLRRARETPTQRYNAEMDYRYSTDPNRPTDERYEKRRDR